jgi:hypothetical protein
MPLTTLFAAINTRAASVSATLCEKRLNPKSQAPSPKSQVSD